MATKIRQFYRLNFVLYANIPFSRKPIFMLPLRLAIKVTLYKQRLSAFQCICSTITDIIWLRFFSRPIITTSKPLRALFPDISLKKLRSTAYTFKNQTGYHFYTRKSHPESFEMWCWRGMIRIDRVKSEVLPKFKKYRNILHTVQWRKANWRKLNWIGHILGRNCLLKHAVE